MFNMFKCCALRSLIACLMIIAGTIHPAPVVGQRAGKQARDARLREQAGKDFPLQKEKARRYRKIPLFEGFKFTSPEDLRRDSQGNYYVVDVKNHRICVFDPEMRFKYQIGRLGQGPEDLNHPGRSVFDTKENLYVVDGDNWRIQIFDKAGRRVGGFHYGYHKTTDLVVTRRSEIYLNQATKGHLISVYSPEGKLLRQFGELMSLSRAYPGRPNDPKYRVPLSRVKMTLDEQDNLYVAYIFVPIIQKYDARGRLLWERRLEGPLADLMSQQFWVNEKDSLLRLTMSIDGLQMPVICKDIAYDDRRRRLFILLSMVDIIYVADENGRKIELLTQSRDEILRREPFFNTLTISQGTLYATAGWSDGKCYRLEITDANKL